MALNGLAGAGQSKTQILESKGIFEDKATGQIQILGGIFNRKKSNSGSSTPTTKKPPVVNGDATSPVTGHGGGGEEREEKLKAEEAGRRHHSEKENERERVAGSVNEKNTATASGELTTFISSCRPCHHHYTSRYPYLTMRYQRVLDPISTYLVLQSAQLLSHADTAAR